MSGGVDSSLAAKLLMNSGYKVIGLTMAIWDGSIPIAKTQKSGCFGPGEAADLAAAADVCKRLGIEHHVIQLAGEYKEKVLGYFCSTYLEGKTPNPCILCNQRMKFGLLPAKAREQGLSFDYFATGHYVRLRYDEPRARYQIVRAKDSSKDQSYFLSFLAQEQLQELIFPLGDLTKSEIKAMARTMGFQYLADKPESQDFLETDDYGVLFEPDSIREGEIVDMNGKVIGTHRGLIRYTIGQRKNLGIAGQAEPYFVIGLDNKANRLIVGPRRYLYSDRCQASGINWVSMAPVTDGFNARAKIRLQHDAAPCKVTMTGENSARVVFDEPQLSVTPGQAIVFYDGDLLLAGAFIE
jgi:tRNA-specific 2-thiouridylase